MTTMNTTSTAWKSEVLVGSEWATNACVYATEEEAYEAGRELLSRWVVPTDHRAAPAEDGAVVNYRFDFDAYRSVRIDG